MPLLEVRGLRVRFDAPHGVVQAVDGVDLDLHEGETLGLVGESGSGKSVTGLALMGLVPCPPGHVEARSITLGGRDLRALPERQMRRLRGREIAMIFQDPMTSLNPLLRIGRQLGEVLELHGECTRPREVRARSALALGEVGIAAPESVLERYPHELSGGMRQRVLIAMALLADPRVLLADEPTTALDVTIQAQVLELLADLQRERGTAILLVTHDLGIVAGRCDRVHVMYAGRIVERAATADLFARPLHPYSAGLLGSVPRLTGDPEQPLAAIPGAPPDLTQLPAGCAFHPRCARGDAACRQHAPPLEPVPSGAGAEPAAGTGTDTGAGTRAVACLYAERAPAGSGL